MADHVQQQILDAVRGLVAGSALPSAANTFLDRVDRLAPDELPAQLVEESPQGETSEPYTISGVEVRAYDVLLTAVVAHATEYGRLARDLGLQLEMLLSGPAGQSVLAPLAKGGWRILTSRLVIDGEGDKAQAARIQTWRFTYFVLPDRPDQPV